MNICKICGKEHVRRGAIGECFCTECLPTGLPGTGQAPYWKKLGIKEAGGKCVKCDYNKCQGALQFHHRVQSEKEFDICRFSRGEAGTRTYARLKKEIDKCDLLCANCHAEIHELEGFNN